MAISTLTPRSTEIHDKAATNTTSTTCAELHTGEIIISRTTFIVAITICVFITCVSTLVLAALLYREHARRRQAQLARSWGRKSTYNHRISNMQKQVDYEFTRQYSGCLHNEPENPCLGSDSPVEMMEPERVWEVPAMPALPRKVAGKDRKSKVSILFDDAVGLWLPRR